MQKPLGFHRMPRQAPLFHTNEVTTKRSLAEGIVARLRAEGFAAYFAGGCVRDLLLGREPHDFDVATSARPETVLEMFPRTRGLVSSLMSFVFTALFTVISGLVCPLIFDSALHLAEAILAGVVLSVIFWRLGAPVLKGAP